MKRGNRSRTKPLRIVQERLPRFIALRSQQQTAI